jgi:hypothetical protein
MTSHIPTQQVAVRRPEQSLARDLFHAARHYLLSRTGLLGIAGVVIVIGAALNWSWLVATGIAPLLIAVLPCAVMCGLGLCAHRLVGGSCAQDQSRAAGEAEQTEASKTQLDLFEPAASASAQLDKHTETQHGVSPASQPSDERRHTHA